MTERIMFRVAVNVETRCWNWLGVVQKNGYGRIRVGTREYLYVHRVSYEAFIGPIPHGLTVDHLCRNSRCVNPEHLEAVTQAENNSRSNGMGAVNARKTHCPQGHEYTPENTYRTHGRVCRTCVIPRNREAARRRRARPTP